jgi:hypothetical protein
MRKARILVPTAPNPDDYDPEGVETPVTERRFTAEHHARFEDEALDLFGGFTLVGLARGAWKDSGVVYRDRSRIYDLAFEPDDAGKIMHLADFAARHYRQLAIYVEVAGEVTFYRPVDTRAA